LDENFTRLITTFDEVPLLCARDEREHDCASYPLNIRTQQGC